MRVTVVYNRNVLGADHPDSAAEQEVGESAMAVCHLLRRAGHEAMPLPVGRELAVLSSSLKELSPDAVFNLYEGMADDPATEARAAQILEKSGAPFTGSPAAALARSGSKERTKRRLLQAGLPTPPAAVVHHLPAPPCTIGWPVIVKPVSHHASEGIEQDSVVTDAVSYRRQVAALLHSHGPVLVEKYVSGPEFMVTVFEGVGRRLPVIGYRFRDPGRWEIASYDAKWTPGSPDYQTTKVELEPNLPRWKADRLRRLGRLAFRALGCRDYARIEIRWPRDGSPVILDVNANCDMGPQSYLGWALSRVGVSTKDYCSALIERARRRRP